MVEVYTNTWVLLHPDPTVAFLERLTQTLPDAALHHSEKGPSNVP